MSPYYCRKDYYQICSNKEKCEYYKLQERIQNERIIIINHALLPVFLKKFPDTKTLFIIDECHELKDREKKIFISEEDLKEPVEPKPENFSSTREYNLALENYYGRLEKYKLSKVLNITSPGLYTIQQKSLLDFTLASEVVFFSGTLQEKLPVPNEEEDILQLQDRRTWSSVKVIIKDVNYRSKDYNQVLKEVVKYAMKNYEKTIILATSYKQLDFIKENFPQIITSKEVKPYVAVQKLCDGEVKAIAGTDIFWTGINIPGKKCIIITKLPFPVPDDKDEESFISGFSEMMKKLKQGFGRMLRSRECGGEIIVLDNRIMKYSDTIAYLEELKNKGAVIVSEVKEENIRRERLRVVK